MDTESMRVNGEGKFLTCSVLELAWNHYAPGQPHEPYVSPSHATDLSGFAPEFIITAECNPVRDESAAYHQTLLDAGVQSEGITMPA